MRRALLVILFAFSILLFRVYDQGIVAAAAETQAASSTEHSEKGGEPEETLGQSVGRWINFAALVAILYFFLKKGLKVQDKFKTDAEEIRRSIESARLAKEEAEQRLSEMDQRLVEMNAEIEKIRAEAVLEAEEEKKRILDSAHKEAERLIEYAHREIDGEVRSSLKELRKQVAESAVIQGRKIIEREIKDADHEHLIADYIERLGK